jgi:hypothetical protein
MDAWTFALAALAGFCAGLLDSIVGGGGLIMTPAMVALFPEWAILNVIATQRTSSIFGTTVAAWNYFRHVRLPWALVLAACAGALPASALGAMLARLADPTLLKWVILGMCVVLAVYTFVRKDLGQKHEPRYHGRHQALVAAGIGAATGFYNGLVGPGTGTLMVFAFASILGLDFLRSSAVSKVTNVAADLSSWTVLLLGGYVRWVVVLPLIIGNMLGSQIGSRMAILRGSRFIRWVFLGVVTALTAKVAIDLARG